MSQVCIEEFFVHRKRKHGHTHDDQDRAPSKVLLLDDQATAPPECKRKADHPLKGRAVLKLDFDAGRGSSAAPSSSAPAPAAKASPKNVKFLKRGTLSPKKRESPKVGNIAAYFTKKNEKPEKATEKVEEKKPLDIKELGEKLRRGGRLAELKSSIDRLKEGFALLEGSKPASVLKEFKEIEVSVPLSPVKSSPLKKPVSPFTSPVKNVLMSPRKPGESPAKSPAKVPAYERFAALASTSSSSGELPLPHHYRWLAEVFRGVETASSMLYNRRETITFSKIRVAIREMLKRDLVEKHLAQIKRLSPEMYSFSREKMKNFGSTAKRDEYELVLTPGSIAGPSMTPDVVLKRRRLFHDLLLDRVMDHHAEYLKSLDPPMNIPKEKLKRWHAEFDIEGIPDVETDALPEPPNVEKYSTAQDVLVHLKEKFNCNTRMERALQKLTEAKARGLTAEEQKATGLSADGSQSNKGSQTTENVSQQGGDEFPLNPALRGLPKALLEKVRAKQAAKALEMMTRTPAQVRNALTYQRLPDLAKLLRNLFVTEKKSVLSLEIILAKLDNSSRHKISSADLTDHLRTLAEVISNWITFYEIRKVEYIKMKKDADMNKILSKLDELARKHSVN